MTTLWGIFVRRNPRGGGPGRARFRGARTLRAGARRRSGTGRHGRARVPRRVPLGARWVPRDLALLHAVGLPDHVDPAARSRVGRDDRAAYVLGAPLPPAAARCVPRVWRASSVFAATVATEQQLSDLPRQVLASILQVVNWFFVFSGQSYVQLFTAPSPVQHFWSLSIEEQFYVFMPLLLLGPPARGCDRRRWSAAVFAFGAIASSALMFVLYERGASLDRLYYGTDTPRRRAPRRLRAGGGRTHSPTADPQGDAGRPGGDRRREHGCHRVRLDSPGPRRRRALPGRVPRLRALGCRRDRERARRRGAAPGSARDQTLRGRRPHLATASTCSTGRSSCGSTKPRTGLSSRAVVRAASRSHVRGRDRVVLPARDAVSPALVPARSEAHVGTRRRNGCPHPRRGQCRECTRREHQPRRNRRGRRCRARGYTGRPGARRPRHCRQ